MVPERRGYKMAVLGGGANEYGGVVRFMNPPGLSELLNN